jgi:hypothetical protein
VIGVDEEGGVFYWTVDGDWLKDSSGNKIPVTGEEGNTPKVIIGSDGYWYICPAGTCTGTPNGDGGWTPTGVKATGEDGSDGGDGSDGVSPTLRINPTTNYWEVCVTGDCDESSNEGWTSTGKIAAPQIGAAEGGGVYYWTINTIKSGNAGTFIYAVTLNNINNCPVSTPGIMEMENCTDCTDCAVWAGYCDGIKYVSNNQSEGSMNWTTANAYCQNKAAGWRLPALGELQCMCSQKANLPDDYVSNYYWSSTNNSSIGSSSYYNVNFSSCGMASGNMNYNEYVKCVK